MVEALHKLSYTRARRRRPMSLQWAAFAAQPVGIQDLFWTDRITCICPGEFAEQALNGAAPGFCRCNEG